MVDFMKIEKIEKYLEEVSEGTDFSFRIADVHDREIELYMQGDNPCNEDWCIDITIKNPKTKKELIETLHEKLWQLYDAFDVEEETYEEIDIPNDDYGYYTFNITDIDDLTDDKEEVINL